MTRAIHLQPALVIAKGSCNRDHPDTLILPFQDLFEVLRHIVAGGNIPAPHDRIVALLEELLHHFHAFRKFPVKPDTFEVPGHPLEPGDLPLLAGLQGIFSSPDNVAWLGIHRLLV